MGKKPSRWIALAAILLAAGSLEPAPTGRPKGKQAAKPASAKRSPSARLTGLEIARKVEQRWTGRDMRAEGTMILRDPKGQERKREGLTLQKRYYGKGGWDQKVLTVFVFPPDLKDTGILSWDYTDPKKDSDQWLWVPSLKKIRRVSGASKEDSFMGSEYLYEDLTVRQPERDNHRILRKEMMQGKTAYVLETTPKEKDYVYSKKVRWIWDRIWVEPKIEYCDRKGELLKTLTQTHWKVIDQIRTPMVSEMMNHQSRYTTRLEQKAVKYNVGVTEEMVSQQYLQRGIR